MAQQQEVILPLQFGEWSPDSASIMDSAALDVARNCYRRDGAYRSIPSRQRIMPPVDRGRILEGKAMRFPDGRIENWIVEENGGVGVLNFESSEVDWHIEPAAREAPYGRDEVSLAQFGNHVVVGFSDSKLRSKDRSDSSAEFEEIEDSPEGAVNLHVFVQYLICSVHGTGRVQWSDANNIRRWPATGERIVDGEVQSAGLAGTAFLPFGGAVRAIFGDTQLIVLTRNASYIMRLSGGASVFNVRRLYDDTGCLTTDKGVARFHSRSYFIAENGVFSISDNGEIASIGRGKIDNWLLGERSPSSKTDTLNVTSAVDWVQGLIFWNVSGRESDHMLIYSVREGAFTTASRHSSGEGIFNVIGGRERHTDDPGLPYPYDRTTDDVPAEAGSTDESRFDLSRSPVVAFEERTQEGQYAIYANDGAGSVEAEFSSKFFVPALLAGRGSDDEYPKRMQSLAQLSSARVKSITPIHRNGQVRVGFSAVDEAKDSPPVLELHPVNESGARVVADHKDGFYFRFRFAISGDWSEFNGFVLKIDPVRDDRTRGGARDAADSSGAPPGDLP